MKEIIDFGAIGEVGAAWCRHFVSYGGDAYFRDWHSERRYATGPLMPDVVHHLKPVKGSHGGADPFTVKRFIDFIRDGVPPNTSPVVARQAVAARFMGTESLRDGNTPRDIPPLDPELVAYFENGRSS